ncbi:branched-chain amino acid transport system substrate-binding protein [Natronorubrum sediminis]|uniref:Branched-chain amino acid transport system substrate-binding protein n=1 Tax=Natronorubrum sediminis TaxID=640943 RepID=A0A1H6FRW8_9EURY|nr:ABC transporter substrate-binding protein [Natronorubrum sediminis]SEH12950.1 branched-chain amino acid transport system substrate-binding protein [Natronorubrum sediminis]
MHDHLWERGANDGSNSRVGRDSLNRRTVLKATGGAAASVSLAGCVGSYELIGSSQDTDETIRIGVLAPEPESDFIGRSMAQSAEVAVTELNEDGGIAGRDVELVVGNTKDSPTEASRVYQQLVLEEDVDVTVGMFDSHALENIMDEIADQELVHLTSGAATTAASQLVNEEYDRYKYHFRVGPTNDRDLGNAQISFMDEYAHEIGWESIAVLAEDYPWADEPWDIYQDELADTQVDVVYEERYPPATNDFTDLYDDIEEAGADAAFVTTAHTGNEAVLDWSTAQRQFAFGGIHVPMQLPTYYDDIGGACEYGIGYSTATETSEITDATQPFVQEYADEFGSYPQDMGYNTYDAVRIFAEAVEAAGTVDSEELVSELEDIEHEGASGYIEFHDSDDEFAHDLVFNPETPTAVYFQWQTTDDGEPVREVIWPEEHATDDAAGEYVTPPWLA